MVYRLLIFIFFLWINHSYANIIYDKNEIIVTDIEINIYKNLYKNNLRNEISDNKAIKNIVLTKKTINYLLKNNPNFISVLDQNIKLEYGERVFDNQNLLNFIRFQQIRNEFISEYFQNVFSMEDLKIIITKFDNLELPLSKNGCLTIEKMYKFNNDKNFLESFFKNLRNKSLKITTSINNNFYEVCMNNKLYKNIETEIIKYITNQTDKEFDKFIRSKNN